MNEWEKQAEPHHHHHRYQNNKLSLSLDRAHRFFFKSIQTQFPIPPTSHFHILSDFDKAKKNTFFSA
jgi:hypothetical protein